MHLRGNSFNCNSFLKFILGLVFVKCVKQIAFGFKKMQFCAPECTKGPLFSYVGPLLALSVMSGW